MTILDSSLGMAWAWQLLIGAIVASVILAATKPVLNAVSTWRLLSKIPSPSPNNVLIGHADLMTSEQAPFLLHDIAKKLGRIYRLRLAWLQVIIVTDPVEAARLCTRGSDYLDKSLTIYEGFNWVHGNPHKTNMLTGATDDAWRAIRRAVAPCFTTANIKSAFPLLLDISNAISQQLLAAGPTTPFNVEDMAKRFTLDAISTWGFDCPVNAATDLSKPHTLVSIVDRMVHTVHTVLGDPLWQLKKWTKTVQDGLKAAKEYDEWMAKFSSGLRSRGDELPAHTIGGALVRLDDSAFGGRLDPETLKVNSAIFMAAGYETTANSLAMCLLLLSNHQEWMHKLETELEEAELLKTEKRQNPRSVSWEDVSHLPVLNAIIKETLRMLPAAGLGSFRCTSKETQICGYRVPKGVIVGFPPYLIDHSTLSYVEEPDEFKPDRWLRKSASTWEQTPSDAPVSDVLQHSRTSDVERLKEPIAFSLGPRDCVGQTLARLEMQVFLVMLLSRFRLHLAPCMGSPKEARDSIIYHLTFTTKNGLWMTAEPR